MINTKIVEILENFGITGKRAAEIMGISHAAFRMKKAQQTYNRFHEEDLQALLDFIREEAKKLQINASDYEKTV